MWRGLRELVIALLRKVDTMRRRLFLQRDSWMKKRVV